MQPEFSILLPSHNGSDTLPECLDALGAVALPETAVEVLLIDNASDDRTLEIFSQYAHNYGWRVLSEPRRGKSFALNAAIEASTGKFIVLIDDDVVPDPGWLRAYQEATRETPNAGAFAGQIRPKWSAGVPGWLQQMADEGRCCGCTALGRTAGPYPALHVKGGNMMVQRSVLGDLRFDTASGNFDGSAQAVGGEDTQMVNRIAEAGNAIIFVPEARVHHILQPHEVTVSALFRRQIRIGRASAVNDQFNMLDRVLTFPAIVAYALAVAGLLAVGMRTHAMKQFLKIGTRFGRIDRWFLRAF